MGTGAGTMHGCAQTRGERMVLKGGGNQWQKPGFSVYLNNHTEKKMDKCQRCENKGTSLCKTCKKFSHFIDRGFYIIERRNK